MGPLPGNLPMKRELQSGKNGVFYLHPLRMLFSGRDLEGRCLDVVALARPGVQYWVGGPSTGLSLLPKSDR